MLPRRNELTALPHSQTFLGDSESEAAETQTWIEIAKRCGYFTEEQASYLDRRYEELLSQLVTMISQPENWTIKSNSSPRS